MAFLGQAGVRHGLSRALSLFEPDLRKPLKAAGMLTRDPELLNVRNMVRRKLEKAFNFLKDNIFLIKYFKGVLVTPFFY